MNRRNSERVSAALGLGFVLDDALIALEIHGPTRAALEEPQAMKAILHRLRRAKETVEDPSRVILSDHEYAYGPFSSLNSAFLQAEIATGDAKRVTETLGRMIGVLEMIVEGNAPPDDALTELKQFLRVLSQALLVVVEEKDQHVHSGELSPLPSLTVA